MPVYTFSVRAKGIDINDNETEDLFASSPIELHLSSRDGFVEIDAFIDADSEVQALRRFEEFSCQVPGLVLERASLDLVTVPEIAIRADVSRQSAQFWVSGKRRANFPAPFESLAETRVWAWSDVFAWLAAEQLSPSSPYDLQPLSSDLLQKFNGKLARQRMISASSWTGSSTGEFSRPTPVAQLVGVDWKEAS